MTSTLFALLALIAAFLLSPRSLAADWPTPGRQAMRNTSES